MSSALDPEVLRDILLTYQDACAHSVTEYDGRIVNVLGDGLVAAFGHPRAHEDDAHRAVRAGLAILEAVARISEDVARDHAVRFAARVGIHTGLVVIADMGSGAGLVSDDLVGETPNIAARVQSLAESNSVVISTATHELVVGAFAQVSLGYHELRGVDGPVELYRVDGLLDPDETVAVAQPRFIGRTTERALLMEAWKECVNGSGRAVLVTGPAGVGKSRLVDAFRAEVVTGESLHIALQCSTYHEHSVLYPLRRYIERSAGISPSDEASTRLRKLAIWAEDQWTGEGADTVAALATLLGIPGVSLQLEPEQVRERIFALMLAGLNSLTARATVLVTVEDVHWADPSTLELLRRIFGHGPGARTCVVVTGRAAARELDLGSDVLVVEVGPLTARESAVLVDEIAPSLPDDIKQTVVERSDGVPLFLGELARMLAVSERRSRSDYAGEVEIPPTLHDLLLARLDQLGDERAVAEVVATIGHSASLPLLEAVIGGDPSVLRARLGALIAAQILRVDRRGAEPVYQFEHVLVRDAAYVSQLRTRRRQVHARVAGILESWIPRTGPLYLELLAFHLEQSGESARAAQRWLEAGLQAAAVAAHSEAAGYYEHALTAIAGATAGTERDALEFDVTNALGLSLLAQRGYTSPDVQSTFGRARALSAAVGAQDRVATLFGLWAYYCVCGDRQTSLDLARHSLATAGEDRFDRPAALAMLSYDLFHVGEIDDAVERLEELEALGPVEIAAFPHDLYAAALVLLAHARWLRGERRSGWQTLAAALERSEELGFPKGPFTRAYVYSYAAWFCQVAGDSDQSAKHATKVIEISAEHGYASWFGAGTLHLGIANSCLGNPGESIPLLAYALDLWRSAGAETFRSYFLAGLANAQRHADDPAAALASVDAGLEHVERFVEHFHEAELRRLRGELLLASGDVGRGEAELWRAVEVARRQHAHSFELRASLALDRAGAGLGPTGEDGRQALLAALAGFAREEDDDELREARARVGSASA